MKKKIGITYCRCYDSSNGTLQQHFASTKLTAVDEIKVGTDKIFTSRVELKKNNDQVDIEGDTDGNFDVYVTLTNGTFAYVDDDDDNAYAMNSDGDKKRYNL